MVNIICKSRVSLDTERLTQLANQVLKKVGFKNKTINLILIDDQEIQEINKTYRGKNKSTDVISYQVADNDFVVGDDDSIFGEIVISYQTAIEQAKELRVSLFERLLVLFIHGFVHILGYDHEKSVAAAKQMVNKEKELLNIIK